MTAIILSSLIVSIISLIVTIIYYENVLIEKDKLLEFGNKLVDIYKEHNSKRVHKLAFLKKLSAHRLNTILDKNYTISLKDKKILDLQNELDYLNKQYVENVSVMPPSKFIIQIHKALNNQLYFTLNYKSNNKVMMTSETYKNKSFMYKKVDDLSRKLNCEIKEN